MMQSRPISSLPVSSLRLGDVVHVPGGLSLSIRASAALPENRLAAENLLVVGEMELVLLTSQRSVAFLHPVSGSPPGFAASKVLCAGLMAFWAPHLPSSAGAAAEVGFQLRMARTSLAPMVRLDRGPESTVFVLAFSSDPSRLMVSQTRPFSGEQDRRRFAATVGSLSPRFDPSPDRARPLPQKR